MASTHLAFTLLMLAVLEDGQADNITSHNGALNVKPLLDPKRRSEIVDETFLEQKDILLDMLETKLKEVRDKKKKKSANATDTNNPISNNNFVTPNISCSDLQNVDVKLKINGISAIGDANVQLYYGNSGKAAVNMEANGISNVGKVRMELGVGDAAAYIPGLSNLFIDRRYLNCTKQNSSDVEKSADKKEEKKPDKTRRNESEIKTSEVTSTVANTTVSLIHAHSHHKHEAKNATSTVQVWNSPENSTLPSVHLTVNSTIGNNTV